MNLRFAPCVSALALACAIVCASGPLRGAHARAGGKPADATAGEVVPAADGRNGHSLVVARNPYTGNAAAIAQGRELFDDKACSGCHGAEGGGGMCPALINDRWVYGSDDTTLFNLIKLGSVGLRASGYARSGDEKVAGDMPPLGSLVSDDEAWRLIAYVRSKYGGDPARRNW